MANPTLMSFGHLLLRKLIQHSRIFDLWKGERRDAIEQASCLVRRMIPPYTQGEAYVRTFLERCQRVRSLSVPGVLPLQECGELDGIPYAVLEGTRGWTLQELLEEQARRNVTLPLEVALQLVLPVAQTLATAHTQETPLVHGALRPRSIWVTKDGTVRVGDFEIGALAEIELPSQENQEQRAWRFQAPDRADDWAAPSPAVDAWSLAATLLELLAIGRLSEVELKLEAPDQLSLLEQRGVPLEVLELIDAGLAEDPADRPLLAEVVRALQRLAASMPAPPPLAARLADFAPPIEEIDPLARPVTDADQSLRRSARRKAGPAGKSPGGAELELPSLEASVEGSPRRTMRLAALAAIGLALAAAVLFWQPLRELLFGPGANMALVVVETDPPGATIEIPGERSIGTSPLKVPVRIAPDGTISLTARLDGHGQAGPLRQEASAGEEVRFRFSLEQRFDAPAAARIVTEPPGARLAVDGKAVKGVSPLEVRELDPDLEHEVTASLAGYRTETKRFRVDPGGVTAVTIALSRRAGGSGVAQKGRGQAGTDAALEAAPPPALPVDPGLEPGYEGPVGYLILESSPSWSHISIDGQPRGRSDSGKRTTLPVGKHVIQFTAWDTKQVASREVRVREGEIQTLEYDFGNGGWRLAPYRPFEQTRR